MDIFQTIFPWMGVALCAMVLGQLAFWSVQSISLLTQNNRQLALSRQKLRTQIESRLRSRGSVRKQTHQQGHWSGFRPFRVVRLVQETNRTTSVYLKPEDGKPLIGFHPGQYVTCRFSLPGESKSLTRCYSLSDIPNHNDYRITVKSVTPASQDPALPPGRVSNYINQSLALGDRVELKSPAGSFFLSDSTSGPIILLAGGIGISPLMAMANHLVAQHTDRLVLMVYGVTDSTDHTFKQPLDQLAMDHKNFHVLNCYSQPLPKDVKGRDYHVNGFASIDCLKQILPNNDCQFYLCGPQAFMQSLHSGLVQWGVPASNIYFEAFGPATIKKKPSPTTASDAEPKPTHPVKFSRSDIVVDYQTESGSLLELAEANGVMIDSGCRSGNCGSCATRLLKGKICYPTSTDVQCEKDECLVCIAEPLSSIELDA